MTTTQRFLVLAVLAVVQALSLTSCTMGSAAMAEQAAARRAALAAEAPGDYFIGRRFFVERTQFWGYVRRPGQDWAHSKLIVMGEQQCPAPDRRPELPTDGGLAHGHDHNSEYRLWGRFSGKKLYDPNSNLILPEFVLQRYELVSTSPGWIFKPGERFNGSQLLRAEAAALP
jgi:hypothetical protein